LVDTLYESSPQERRAVAANGDSGVELEPERTKKYGLYNFYEANIFFSFVDLQSNYNHDTGNTVN
jgi:hypothetical protein